MLELIVSLLPYVLLGSSVKVIWGLYRAYTTYMTLSISWRRIAMEFVVGIFFGIFGGVILNELKIFAIGVNLGSLVSSILGANVIDVIAKKFGFSRKMEMVVSDQQLKFPDLNENQMNALSYLKLGEGKMTNKVYQKINKVSRDVARHELDSLVEKGYLKMKGKGKGAYYILLK